MMKEKLCKDCGVTPLINSQEKEEETCEICKMVNSYEKQIKSANARIKELEEKKN